MISSKFGWAFIFSPLGAFCRAFLRGKPLFLTAAGIGRYACGLDCARRQCEGTQQRQSEVRVVGGKDACNGCVQGGTVTVVARCRSQPLQLGKRRPRGKYLSCVRACGYGCRKMYYVMFCERRKGVKSSQRGKHRTVPPSNPSTVTPTHVLYLCRKRGDELDKHRLCIGMHACCNMIGNAPLTTCWQNRRWGRRALHHAHVRHHGAGVVLGLIRGEHGHGDVGGLVLCACHEERGG